MTQHPDVCDLCGHHETNVLVEDDQGWVVKCRQCSNIFVIYRDI